MTTLNQFCRDHRRLLGPKRFLFDSRTGKIKNPLRFVSGSYLAGFVGATLYLAWLPYPAAQAGTVWDGGGGGNTNINTAANWDGDTLPVTLTDGTQILTFGTAGSTATINTDVNVSGLVFNRDAAFTIATGTGNLTIGTGGITNNATAITASRTYTINEGIILNGNQTWSVNNKDGTILGALTVGGVVSGSSAITKTGNGTLTLSGNNTYSGGTILRGTGSRISITNSSGLGSGNVTIESTGLASANTGAFVSLNTNGIIANNFTISGHGTANGAIQSFASNATLSGLVTLAGDAMIATRTTAGNGKLFITGGITNGGSNRTLTLNAFCNATISGNEITISTNSVNLGSGGTLDLGSGIQNGGSGTFNINVGNNTWGTTIVRAFNSAGNSSAITLNLGAANALGSSSSVLQLGNSTTSLEQITVNLNGNNQTIGGLRSFGSTGSASANGTRTVTSATAATLTIDNSSATNYLYDGVISGSISLLKNGTATQTLAGNNTYTGNTTVAGGTLRLAGNGTLGTSTISISGGTLDMGGKSLTNTFGSLTGGTLSNGTLTNNGGNYDLQSGTVSAVLAGTNGVNKTSSGTVRLTGQNTYQGATTIQNGTLEIASTGAIGNTSRIDVNNIGSILLVTVADTLNNTAEINLNNGQMSLMGNFSETFGNLTSNGSSRIDLASFSGVLRFGGVGSWGANSTLEILNWNSGTQNIVFTDDANLSSYLNQISFYSNSGDLIGTASRQNYTGIGAGTEIIAVPEPETYIIVMVFLLGFGIYQIRLARHGQGLLSRLTFLRCTAQRKPFEGQPPA